MTAPITLVLNGEAVNALFPEGSEARVKLSNAAIQAMLKGIDSREVMKGLLDVRARLIQEVREACYQDLGIGDGFGSPVYLGDRARCPIIDAVKERFSAEVDSAARAAAETLKPGMAEAIQRAIDRFVTKSLSIKLEPSS